MDALRSLKFQSEKISIDFSNPNSSKILQQV
jgi:hypothetical protein